MDIRNTTGYPTSKRDKHFYRQIGQDCLGSTGNFKMWLTLFVLALASQGILGDQIDKYSTESNDDEDDADYTTDADFSKDFTQVHHPRPLSRAHDHQRWEDASAKATANVVEAAMKAAKEAKEHAVVAAAAAKKASDAAKKAADAVVAAAQIAAAQTARQAARIAAVSPLAAAGAAKILANIAAKKAAKPAGKAAASRKRPMPKPTSASTTTTASPNQVSSLYIKLTTKFKYESDLNNVRGEHAKKITEILCHALKSALESKNLLGCEVQKFEKGSLVAFMKLRVKLPQNEAKKLLKKAVASKYVGSIPVSKIEYPKSPLSAPGSKSTMKAGASLSKCRPCWSLPTGIRLLRQSSCPTGYCATIQINPQQIAAPAASAMSHATPSYQQPQMPSYQPQMPSYQPQMSSYQPQMSPYQYPMQSAFGSGCPPMCQPSAPNFSCAPGCPQRCCRRGK
ncbi:uncharacterized protein LOC116618532 isoform X2 [Nematostella vectensis]|uniref:uncharacterized protein LOC116618532 isoform X2 n=1 Tax=Nematostella vectensis TaxID=45351 RepID=UPI00207762A8|nr:uncharacterized protein LOC116618532 isoform X2 [Nematostella vectensis]